MGKKFFEVRKKVFAIFMAFLCVNVCNTFSSYSDSSEEDSEVGKGGDWSSAGSNRSLDLCSISIYKNSQYLTIQDSEPVNTITVRITNQTTGAVVYENTYPQGQTGYIVIPITGWSTGTYTIELFGSPNNGYLVGSFRI